MVVKFFLAGGTVGILGRRALTPVLVVGTAFSSAAWFGIFEIATGFLELGMPVPKEPDSSAHYKGFATIPCSVGVVGWAAPHVTSSVCAAGRASPQWDGPALQRQARWKRLSAVFLRRRWAGAPALSCQYHQRRSQTSRDGCSTAASCLCGMSAQLG